MMRDSHQTRGQDKLSQEKNQGPKMEPSLEDCKGKGKYRGEENGFVRDVSGRREEWRVIGRWEREETREGRYRESEERRGEGVEKILKGRDSLDKGVKGREGRQGRIGRRDISMDSLKGRRLRGGERGWQSREEECGNVSFDSHPGNISLGTPHYTT